MLEAMLGTPKKKGKLPRPPYTTTPGFKGELGQDYWLGFEELTVHVGLTAGFYTNMTEPWMFFIRASDNKEIYFPKKAFRHTITWEQLNTLGVSAGTKTITVGGKTFRIRLFKVGDGADYEARLEWKDYVMGLNNGTYGNYSPADMGTGTSTVVNGELCICQDVHRWGGHSACAYRGINEVWNIPVNTTNEGYGWKPFLEEV